jgi:hypothetical protein
MSETPVLMLRPVVRIADKMINTTRKHPEVWAAGYHCNKPEGDGNPASACLDGSNGQAIKCQSGLNEPIPASTSTVGPFISHTATVPWVSRNRMSVWPSPFTSPVPAMS